MMNCRRRGRKKLFFDVTPNIRAPSVGGRKASRLTLADRVDGSKLGHTSKQIGFNEKNYLQHATLKTFSVTHKNSSLYGYRIIITMFTTAQHLSIS
jgi:hypothetical protein